ncbi:hypothetical protein [Siphonobacter sp. SORGH_AS_1065]|uniref:hypothetical protein n=1 Tax=Siphonobacter sp. SORGH_AS_1065 TaxID=3041795 RepID=UPI002786F1CA|nr:hypothetical protein [Siphonobacter sp. SORGH_AS_1065]MDQ1085664.1 hypothetical protein [Siphonobacter sp. SORGH_AS_1065]
MAQNESNSKSEGIGLLGLVFIVFLVLKLTSVITWSWWWITAPLWGPIALVAAGFILFVIYQFIKHSGQK